MEKWYYFPIQTTQNVKMRKHRRLILHGLGSAWVGIPAAVSAALGIARTLAYQVLLVVDLVVTHSMAAFRRTAGGAMMGP